MSSPEQVIEGPKILPFDVCMRTAVRVPQLAEQQEEVPTSISYSSLQRTVEQHVDQFLVFKVFPLDSSTATLSSKKRISERIVEQIVDPVSSGRLVGSLPGQGSSSSHSPAGVEERADELGKGVFALFPPKKSAKLAPHSGSELLPESSPPTRAAQLEDSVEWVRLRDDNSGKPYYWNRRTRATVWKAPAGVKVVLAGEVTEEGQAWY